MRLLVNGQHLLGPGCKLNFCHGQQGPPGALHHKRVQGVVEGGAAICPQAHLAARRLGGKAIAQQSQQDVVVAKLAQHVGLGLAIAGDAGRKNDGVYGGGFELVAHAPVDGVDAQKVV